MVRIRLRKTGCKNDVSYRVVATDSRSPRDGRFLETLGWYDPAVEGVNYRLDGERIEYWRVRGAQVSESVASLLKRARRDARNAPAAEPVAVAAVEPAAVETSAVEATPVMADA